MAESEHQAERIPHGRRLIPTTIDQLAQATPNKLFACIPKTSNLSDGYRDITYRDLARGIDHAAAWIEERFGVEGEGMFGTLAYVGVFDLRYFFFMCGAAKVGFKTLLPSPRNTLEGQLSLFNSTDCKALLISEGFPIPTDLITASDLQPITVPSLDSFLEKDGEVKHYPFNRTFEEAENDPFTVLHTSGSTGLPKPVVLKHGWFSTMDAVQEMPLMPGGEKPLWMRCVNLLLQSPIWYGAVCIWPPSNLPMSGLLADGVLFATPVDIAFFVPSVLEEMCQSPSSIAKLKKLSGIGFGGGPMNPAVGALLQNDVPLLHLIGSTEICIHPIYERADEDWLYFHYNPALKGIEFRPLGDGTFEQVVVRHPSTDRFHSLWYTFPDLDVFPMNDLYRPHPSKPNTWQFLGRADDVIVFSNGEKLNPTTMESTLRSHPDIMGALVVGQGQFSPAAIIELTPEVAEKLQTAEEKTMYVENEIWKVVLEANKHAPAHGQLERDMVILSVSSKPFGRAGKGTILRASTIENYKPEIEELYRRNGEGNLDIAKIELAKNLESFEKDIGAMVTNIIGAQTPLARDMDFFAAGMDSLHVMTAVKHLKAALAGISSDNINARLIYGSPTVASLSAALKTIVDSDGLENLAQTREQVMEAILEEFVQQLTLSSTKANFPSASEKMTVLLTGSTGSLGSYLLHVLLSSPKVAKIYCLNRREDAAEFQAALNAQRGLVSLWDDRVEFLKADLSQEGLGLKAGDYERLKQNVTIVIHNQWNVNFNLALPSFLPHIAGVFNLTKFSASATFSPPITFISSIGTVTNYSSLYNEPRIPELPFHDPKIAAEAGYSESKWIAERLLEEAGKRGLRSNILRVGQIAGPVEGGMREMGQWNKSEWFPSLITSSTYLKCVPTELPGHSEVAFIPVDALSKIIYEIVEADISTPHAQDSTITPTKIFHLANPVPSDWSTLLPIITEHSSHSSVGSTENGKSIESVPFPEWFSKLEASSKTDVDADANPATKLLPFYQGMRDGTSEVKLDTTRSMQMSETLRGLKLVGEEWMEIWLKQWERESGT
ncbi:acetyl-CoA synthetase-like protein [Cadophora sp. DSE1049]|nr:acetyl-CoA synthetase-like protein [Cadophora sp. DSE1049]